MAEAYSEEPSRLTTSTWGCAWNQAETVSTERSASRSIGWRLSRSQINVPYRCLRFHAQSSMPTIGDFGGSGSWWRRTRRKMVSRLPLKPCSLPISAPACPPDASPSWQRAFCNWMVRWAWGRQSSGSRSVKIFCAQVLLVQKKRRTCSMRNRTPAGWQVMQSACISTLHTCGEGATTRAWSCWGGCPQRQRDLISYMHLLDAYFRKVGKNDDSVQCVPRRRGRARKNVQLLSISHFWSARLRKSQVMVFPTHFIWGALLHPSSRRSLWKEARSEKFFQVEADTILGEETFL